MARSASVQTAQVGLASDTSMNGVARNGTSISIATVAAGSLSIAAQATIVTSSVVATFRPQVSLDNTNWYDVRLSNSAALVTVAASASLALQLADLSGWKFFRVVATLSGAATAAGDLTKVDYVYRKFGSA
jgi:hypothetical protein